MTFKENELTLNMLDITIDRLPSPEKIKASYPLKDQEFIQKAKGTAKEIFLKKDPRSLAICGPCSVHDLQSTIELAHSFKSFSLKNFFFIMRIYCEKPRTTIGWKGLLYDPELNDSHDIEKGIIQTRKLLLKLASLQIPCATEFLDPLIAPYIDDLITWGFIGARTVASQPHRQLSSSFSFPVGFKNGVDGNIELAVQGAFSSQHPQCYVGLNNQGEIAKIRSKGNLFTHIVLRGSNKQCNFDPESVENALGLIDKYQIQKRILIDCSHGNSKKTDFRQIESFKSVIQQILNGNNALLGVMLETHLHQGNQTLDELPLLKYGVSVTDPCLGFESTKELLLGADELLCEQSVAL